jgi:hypothetical protein
MTRDAFHRRAPFVGSGGHYSPGPATARPLLATVRPTGWRCHATLGLRRPAPLWSDARTTHERLFARSARRRLTADARSELGPRSLAADHRFCGARASLFGAGRRFPTSATQKNDARARSPSSAILAGTEAVTSFLFGRITHDLPCGSGDTRRAVHRPFVPTPVPVPPACAGLPGRDIDSNALPSRACAHEVAVAIDVHGPEDRAKDASRTDARCTRRLAAVHTR